MAGDFVAVLADRFIGGGELPGVAADFAARLDPGVPVRLGAVRRGSGRCGRTDLVERTRAESGSDSPARDGSSRKLPAGLKVNPASEPGFQETA
ncbi:hypothetical protein OG840_57970 [Streptomyces sp. NBC_01764]|uniref:hypothetical protein n=1 Tax=Streptomyces sp. NBC_01764 TaxID=2975935 RepID=UPI002258442B|nr:hypothetical protein [Streptomyces sp. NBC_01764]MCX4410925.1 hypothetical protein [Streptomyces sp. NBC_01764]